MMTTKANTSIITLTTSVEPDSWYIDGVHMRRLMRWLTITWTRNSPTIWNKNLLERSSSENLLRVVQNDSARLEKAEINYAMSFYCG
jgi:hypothetical protein